MTEEFHRIRRLPPYVFAEVNKAKARARAEQQDIIDLGMGNPDSPTPPHIVAKLIETVADPRTHPLFHQRRHSRPAQSFGRLLPPPLRRVARPGYRSDRDPRLKGRPGEPRLGHHQPGRHHPGAEPVPTRSTSSASSSPALRCRSIPAHPGEAMLRALENGVRHSVPKPTALIVNFPSNPTAYLADLDFYKELVAFARRHEIWILSDLAYAEIYFGDTIPPSILQVPGARDIAVEFTSMSKTYSMPGWRIGFAAGNPHLIKALARIKSYLDYGAFTPIQVAATAALNGPQDCVTQMRELYKERRDVLIKGLAQAGWEMPSPEGSMFAWAPIPPRFAHLGSVEFSKLLLARAQVAVAPGLGFGEHGDGHVRIGLVENTQRLRQAIRNIRSFLQADSNIATPVLEATT